MASFGNAEMAAQKMSVIHAFFLLPFLDILSTCFILFLFLRDADSRKGTLCPFYVPDHKKKGKKKVSDTTNHQG